MGFISSFTENITENSTHRSTQNGTQNSTSKYTPRNTVQSRVPLNLSERITVPTIRAQKSSACKIVALTAYDYTMARILDASGIDIILVGDSLGFVIQGHENTLPVTLDEMIYHSRCVTRAVSRALVVGDLPFLSYQVSPEKAIEAAGRLLKEGQVSAVKLEGGISMAQTIKRLVEVDIPVMGHVGLTPQSYHRMGGYKIQGKDREDGVLAGSRAKVLEDALAVEKAGAFSLVVEGVPEELAKEITESVSIPTIGIGAGRACDGQILVAQDMLGMIPDFRPKFVKRYAELAITISEALQSYSREVREGIFPEEAHVFGPVANTKL